MSKAAEFKRKIVEARDLLKQPVSVPEWGLEEGLYVKALTILDAMAFDAVVDGLEDEKVPGVYVAFTLCDEDCELVFDPATESIEVFKKNPEVVARLFREALLANGRKLAKPDDEKAGLGEPVVPGKS